MQNIISTFLFAPEQTRAFHLKIATLIWKYDIFSNCYTEWVLSTGVWCSYIDSLPQRVCTLPALPWSHGQYTAFYAYLKCRTAAEITRFGGENIDFLAYKIEISTSGVLSSSLPTNSNRRNPWYPWMEERRGRGQRWGVVCGLTQVGCITLWLIVAHCVSLWLIVAKYLSQMRVPLHSHSDLI